MKEVLAKKKPRFPVCLTGEPTKIRIYRETKHAHERFVLSLVRKYRLEGWVKLDLAGRQVVWQEAREAREAEAQLDGCYVVKSDLPVGAASTPAGA